VCTVESLARVLWYYICLCTIWSKGALATLCYMYVSCKISSTGLGLSLWVLFMCKLSFLVQSKGCLSTVLNSFPFFPVLISGVHRVHAGLHTVYKGSHELKKSQLSCSAVCGFSIN
jgi:hypothetical protein